MTIFYWTLLNAYFDTLRHFIWDIIIQLEYIYTMKLIDVSVNKKNHNQYGSRLYSNQYKMLAVELPSKNIGILLSVR